MNCEEEKKVMGRILTNQKRREENEFFIKNHQFDDYSNY